MARMVCRCRALTRVVTTFSMGTCLVTRLAIVAVCTCTGCLLRQAWRALPSSATCCTLAQVMVAPLPSLW